MTSTLINDRISSAAVLRRGNFLARTEAVSLIMSSDTRKACGLRNVALNSLCSFPRNAIPETGRSRQGGLSLRPPLAGLLQGPQELLLGYTSLLRISLEAL